MLHSQPTPFRRRSCPFLLSITRRSLATSHQRFHLSGNKYNILNRYRRLVNTIDTNISWFAGWISIKGLPFDSWTLDTFENVAKECGGPQKWMTNSKPHKYIGCNNQSEQRGVYSIPQIIHFTFDGICVPLQLTHYIHHPGCPAVNKPLQGNAYFCRKGVFPGRNGTRPPPLPKDKNSQTVPEDLCPIHKKPFLQMFSKESAKGKGFRTATK